MAAGQVDGPPELQLLAVEHPELDQGGGRPPVNALGAHSETTVMVGDRMDTDVVAGLEAGLETVLVLSGVTREHEVERFPYRPSRVVADLADLADELEALPAGG